MNKLAYLDHNILNFMVKGGKNQFLSEFSGRGLLPVYSDENLREIERSSVRADQFLELLESIGAWHLSTPMDGNFITTEQFVVTNTRARDRLQELQEARSGYENIGTNLDFLCLMYGGAAGKLPSEILLDGIAEAESIFQSQISDPELERPEFIHFREQAEAGLLKIEDVKIQIREGCKELDERAKNGPLTDQAAEEIGIGPKQLNNIGMPGAMEKIWKLVGPKYGPNCETIDDFLLMALSFNSDGPRSQPEVVSRANGLYNLLNMFGYYRDEGLKKTRRMRASFSDMTHVGYAIVCEKFYCDDFRMRVKAAAIYEHIGVSVDLCSSSKCTEVQA